MIPNVIGERLQEWSTDPDSGLRNAGESLQLAERAARLTSGRDPGVLNPLASACAAALNAKIGFYKAGGPFIRPR